MNRRLRRPRARRPLRIAAAGAALAATLALATPAANAAEGCGVVNHNVCITVSDVDPVTNTTLDPIVTGGAGRDVVTVTNKRAPNGTPGNTVNKITATVSGAQFLSTTNGTISGNTVTFGTGQLRPGQSVQAVVQYAALSSPGTLNVCGRVVWNEGAKQGGRQDLASACEPTAVSDTATQSAVPTAEQGDQAGITTLTLKVDPPGVGLGTANIPLLSGVQGTAQTKLASLPSGYSCDNGVFRFEGDKWQCSPGGFFQLDVTAAGGGSPDYPNSDPLEFVDTLPPSAKPNFPLAVFFADDTGPVIGLASEPCGVTVPDFPDGCIASQSVDENGTIHVTSRRLHNGRRY